MDIMHNENDDNDDDDDEKGERGGGSMDRRMNII